MSGVISPELIPPSSQEPRVENWHGTEVVDSFAWLEGGKSVEVQEWTAGQNKLARQYLDNIPGREPLKSEFLNSDLGVIGCPFRIGDYVFQHRRDKGQGRPVMYVTDTTAKANTEEVLLDQNTLNSEGTLSVDWFHVTNDGRFMAYGVSENGSEQGVLKIRDTKTKEDLAEEIPGTDAYCSVAWLPDNSGFYYTKFVTPDVDQIDSTNPVRKLLFHKIGSDYKEDPVIYSPKNPGGDWLAVSTPPDGEWMQLSVSHRPSNDVYICRMKTDGVSELIIKPLIVGEDALTGTEAFGGYVYIQTTLGGSSRYKLMRVSLEEGDLSDISKWEEVVNEEEATLEDFKIIGGKLILQYQDKAQSRMDIIDLNSQERKRVQLPGIGSVDTVNGEQDKPELYYSFESFSVPRTIYRLNVDTLVQEKVDEVKINEDLSDIITEQVTYNSKDGTPVTMFIVHKKGIERNGNNKTILDGYGSFGEKETPSFSRYRIPWLKSGGIYAIANIRGGGEYGEEWHRNGMLDKKQNSFDDYIAAEEHLIHEGYTQPKRLAIRGGSAGGLLVGAAMVQRPELVGAVICSSGVLDMLRFNNTEIGRAVMDEFGDPSKPEDFKYLYQYSPYHHVKDGIAYPAVLFIVGENDTRVDPMHSRKMAARLQEATVSGNPILLLGDSRSGHGYGNTVSQMTQQQIDTYSFLESVLSS